MADDSFDEETIKKMQDLFTKYADENGYLKIADTLKLLQLLNQNPTNSQLSAAITDAGLTDTDLIQYPDFESIAWYAWNDAKTEEELRAAFKQLDKDNNGYLDADEFKNVMMSYGESFTLDELTELMKLVDVDSNNKIDYEEFVRMITAPEELVLGGNDEEELAEGEDDEDDEEEDENEENE